MEAGGLPEVASADRFVEQMVADWRQAGLCAADRALCGLADKLSRRPETMARDDVEALREHGFDDVAVHDAVQVISYFNYINRVADALGVEPDEWLRPWENAAERE